MILYSIKALLTYYLVLYNVAMNLYSIKALLIYCLVLYNAAMILYSINYTCLLCEHGGCDLVRFCVFQFQTDWNDFSDLSWEVYYWVGKDSSVSGTTSP